VAVASVVFIVFGAENVYSTVKSEVQLVWTGIINIFESNSAMNVIAMNVIKQLVNVAIVALQSN
jgi:hypothetical protein